MYVCHVGQSIALARVQREQEGTWTQLAMVAGTLMLKSIAPVTAQLTTPTNEDHW